MVIATQELASILQARQERVAAQASHRENFTSAGTLSAKDIAQEAATPLFQQGGPSMGGGLRRRGGHSDNPFSGGQDFLSGALGPEEDEDEYVLSMPSATEMNEQMQLRRHGDKSRLAAAEGVERMM